MTDRDRLMRLERIILGDGVDEPGVLTRLATIQAMLSKHIDETAMPTRSVILALVLGALVSAAVGMGASAVQAHQTAHVGR
jgi:hypothetical protein